MRCVLCPWAHGCWRGRISRSQMLQDVAPIESPVWPGRITKRAFMTVALLYVHYVCLGTFISAKRKPTKTNENHLAVNLGDCFWVHWIRCYSKSRCTHIVGLCFRISPENDYPAKWISNIFGSILKLSHMYHIYILLFNGLNENTTKKKASNEDHVSRIPVGLLSDWSM